MIYLVVFLKVLASCTVKKWLDDYKPKGKNLWYTQSLPGLVLIW